MTITPSFRFRRLRKTSVLRSLIRETQVSVNDLILPIFVEEGISEAVPIVSMPGVFRYPEAQLPALVQCCWDSGVKAVILFGVSRHKDDVGSDSWSENGLMARIIQHEYDHLDGVLFIDHLPRWQRWLLAPRLAWIALSGRWERPAEKGSA